MLMLILLQMSVGRLWEIIADYNKHRSGLLLCGCAVAGVYVDKYPYVDSAERAGEHETFRQPDDQRRRKPGHEALYLETLCRF